MSNHIWSLKMQVMAGIASWYGALPAVPIMVVAMSSAGGTAWAMELDHTHRIEKAAVEVGCVVREIDQGKKRLNRMIYRVVCEQDGKTVDREVACNTNLH